MASSTDQFAIPQQPTFVHNALHIQNLPPDCTEDQLHELLTKTVPVLSVRLMKSQIPNGASRAYANFHTAEAAAKVLLELNGHLFGRRQISIAFKESNPLTRKLPAQNQVYVQVRGPNNTAPTQSVSREVLLDRLSKFGDIVTVYVGLDTHASKLGTPVFLPFGTVQFQSRAAAEEAVKAGQVSTAEGQVLHLSKFEAPANRSTTFNNTYVRDLPLEWTEEKVRKVFETLGELGSVMLRPAREGLAGLDGFVCFKSPESAAAAVKAFEEKKGVFADYPMIRMAAYMPKHKRQQARMMRMKARQAQLVRDTGKRNVYVKFLPPNMTTEMLVELFSTTGAVESARAVYDGYRSGTAAPEGGYKCTGVGYVLFKDEESANRAVQQASTLTVPGNARPIVAAIWKPKEVRHRENVENLSRAALIGQQRAGQVPFAYGQQMPFMYHGPMGMVPMQGQFAGLVPHNQFPVAHPNMRPPRSQWQTNAMQGAGPHAGRYPRGPRAPMQADMAHAHAGAMAVQHAAPAPVQQPPMFGGMEDLAGRIDAAADDNERRTILGSALYPVVQAVCGQQDAGKVTGMLLQGITRENLVKLLVSDQKGLRQQIDEANAVLKAPQ